MPNGSTLLTPMHPISLSIVEPASGKGSLGRCITILLFILLFIWAGQAYAEPVDTITFSDGEQLAGKLVSIRILVDTFDLVEQALGHPIHLPRIA